MGVASATYHYYTASGIILSHFKRRPDDDYDLDLTGACGAAGTACNPKPIQFLLGVSIVIILYGILITVLRYLNISLIIKFNIMSSIVVSKILL